MSCSLKSFSNSQEKMVDLYIDPSKEEERVFQYQKDKYGNVGFIKVNVPAALFGLTIGGITGTGVGMAIGGGIGFCVAGPPGAATGMGIGAVIGGVSGAIGGAAYAVKYRSICIQRSSAFTDWKMNSIRDRVYPVFYNFLHENDFEDFIDPFTCEIIVVPVKAPDGRIYDRESAESWIDQVDKINEKKQADFVPGKLENGEEKKLDLTYHCPQRTGMWTKKDLIYDQESVSKIYKRAKSILKQSIKCLPSLPSQLPNIASLPYLGVDMGDEKSSVIIDGLRHLVKTIKDNNCSLQKSTTKLIIEEFNEDGDVDKATNRFKKSLQQTKLD